MSKIKFKAEENKIYDGDFSQIGKNQVRLTFHDEIPEMEALLSGFNLVNEHNNKIVQTPREDYKYLYRTYDGDPNKIELCNDNIPWVEPPKPEPVPEPEPYVPTLEEVKEKKIWEMNAEQQTTIQNGIDVTLTDGTVEHFTLTDHDQTSLMGLQTQIVQGVEQIPWHTSDQDDHCKYYSNADMSRIVTAAMGFVTYHVTYFRDLRIYINSMLDKESVEAVEYGIYIPKEYQSEVLKDLYTSMR